MSHSLDILPFLATLCLNVTFICGFIFKNVLDAVLGVFVEHSKTNFYRAMNY